MELGGNMQNIIVDSRPRLFVCEDFLHSATRQIITARQRSFPTLAGFDTSYDMVKKIYVASIFGFNHHKPVNQFFNLKLKTIVPVDSSEPLLNFT
jgi:hypothetical protein